MENIEHTQNQEKQTPQDVNSLNHFTLPNQRWFTLKDCCSLKNLNYKTACNRKSLQPNLGMPDGVVGGRKVFSYATVLEWIEKTDDELDE